MIARSLVLIAGLSALSAAATALPAAAEATQPTGKPRLSHSLPQRTRPRIEVNPQPLLYRRCVDWYELQHRPSGTVLFPRMHCWWVRG